MTDDEMNRKMEFIVEQQAQFTADIQILKERQEQLRLRQEQFQGQLETLGAVAGTALEASTRTAEIVTALASTWSEAQAKTERQFARTDRQIARVAWLLGAHIREGHPPGASPA